MRYISRISSAIQNISEGDLNTTIEVRGDDEFTAMAVNLNKMVGGYPESDGQGARGGAHEERADYQCGTRSADTADLDHRLS